MKTKNETFSRMGMIVAFFLITLVTASCEEWPYSHGGGQTPANRTQSYPADVAVAWINLQQELTKTTPGFDPLVAARAFSYSGVTLYESVVKGMPGYKSIAAPFKGENITHPNGMIFWPASANAAMAQILRQLYGNTSSANQSRIDSLEASFVTLFSGKINDNILEKSKAYGTTVANEVFQWSKSDGGHEAYLSNIDPTYTAPTGPGLWIPTPPAFGSPIRPKWGNNRSFVPNVAQITLPPAPPLYGETETSEFYTAAMNVYNASKNLTADDLLNIKTWGDLPGNYGTSSHYTHIATQLIESDRVKLDKAALVYAMHGMAIYDATIAVFKAKYTYNVIRPVSFVRNVFGHTTWSSVIGTPPHPEYPSAHATIGGASCVVLETFFGKNRPFVDRTHEKLYGARPYNRLKDYAVEAAHSRFLGGLHYAFSAHAGLLQGEKIGTMVLDLPYTDAAPAQP
jgi:hypothetical protein